MPWRSIGRRPLKRWRRCTVPSSAARRIDLREHENIYSQQADHGRPFSSATALLRGLRDLPELNVAVFALLLNFPWEFLQAPFFASMASAPHWPATKDCAQAAVGDATMTLIAYWLIALCMRSRHWVRTPSPSGTFGFVCFLVVLNVGIEKLATEHLGRWSYAVSMPIVPLLGMGVLPLIQWLLLPPVVIWFVHRQLSSSMLATRSQPSSLTIGDSRSVDRGPIRHDTEDRR